MFLYGFTCYNKDEKGKVDDIVMFLESNYDKPDLPFEEKFPEQNIKAFIRKVKTTCNQIHFEPSNYFIVS